MTPFRTHPPAERKRRAVWRGQRKQQQPIAWGCGGELDRVFDMRWIFWLAGSMALPERMDPFHPLAEQPDGRSPLPLLSASLSTKSLSSPATGLQPPRMPEPTPLRLSSAEDRLRSGVSAGLLGEPAEMAQDAPGLLDEISPGPPSAGGTKPSKTALAGPKTAAGESCKQQLGYQPSGEFSIACPF
jgi:hypothetical protein